MKRIRILLLCLLLQAGARIWAQSFYELDWSRENVEYNGFLVFFSEEEITMRIGFEYNGGYNVVRTTYSLEQDTMEDGTEFIVLSGSDARMLQAETVEGYSADHFFWYLENNAWKGPFTMDDSDLESEEDLDPVETVFKALEKEDLTESFLRQFYIPADPEYVALLHSTEEEPVAVDQPDEEERDVTLHLIIAANTLISDIGTASQMDRLNVASEFQGISDKLGIRYKEKAFTGRDFDKDNLMTYLRNFEPGPNDVVIFLYTGHGYRFDNQASAYPQLDMRYSNYQDIDLDRNTLNLEEVFALLKTKGARLNLSLADCCNNQVGFSRSMGNNFLVTRTTVNAQSDKLKHLFLNSKGNLIFAAAGQGEYSWCSPQTGGFFTSSLIAALRQEISYLNEDEPRWDDIVAHTVDIARKKSELCSNCSTQNAIYWDDIEE